MPNSEYSNFQLEDILTEKYKNLCDHLLRMTNVGHIKEKMKRNIV